jgi:putative phosphoesterase
MKVLIVSDTHGRDENLEEAVYREAPFDYLIHCGDVEGREIFIEALAECPCSIVAGNNDFFTDLPQEEEITLEGYKILVTHGHYYFVSRDHDRIVEKAKAKDCQIVMYGPILR